MDTISKLQQEFDFGEGELDSNREGINGGGCALENAQETRILLVDRELLPYAWNFVLPLLETAKDHYDNYYSEADILQQLLSKTSHLWIIARTEAMGDIRCLVITEWLGFPKNKVLRIKMFAAKELSDYVPRILSAIEDWAIKNGATRIQVTGRPAWISLLKEHGYQPEAIVLFKDMAKGEG